MNFRGALCGRSHTSPYGGAPSAHSAVWRHMETSVASSAHSGRGGSLEVDEGENLILLGEQ